MGIISRNGGKAEAAAAEERKAAAEVTGGTPAKSAGEIDLDNKHLPLFSARVTAKSMKKIERLKEEYRAKFGRKPDSKGALLDFILSKVPSRNVRERDESNCWESYKKTLLECREIQDGLIEGTSYIPRKWNDLKEKLDSSEWTKLWDNVASADELDGTEFNPAHMRLFASLTTDAAAAVNVLLDRLLGKTRAAEEENAELRQRLMESELDAENKIILDKILEICKDDDPDMDGCNTIEDESCREESSTAKDYVPASMDTCKDDDPFPEDWYISSADDICKNDDPFPEDWYISSADDMPDID